MSEWLGPGGFKKVWLGITAENQARLSERLPHLLKVPGNRFLSLEPLLGEIDLFDDEFTQTGRALFPSGYNPFDWVIVGCETGPGRRECKIEWIESVVDQCKEAGVPCWVKAVEVNGKLIKKFDDLPASVRVRELPFETPKPGTSSLK
jgi:protein gp37